MKQTLHILRKDIRHLWPWIAMVLFLIVAHAVFAVLSLPVDIPQMARINSISSMLTLLLPLCLCVLVAMLIFQEALPGDRQFWLTRPYSWHNLLAAKLLFILLFFNAPLFLSDCFILKAQTLPVLSVLPELFLRQPMLTLLFILPSFAIAVLTAGIAQYLVAWFLLLLALISEMTIVTTLYSNDNGARTGVVVGTDNNLVIVLLLLVCAAIVWQFAKRHTIAARLVVFGAVCALIPLTWAIALVRPPKVVEPQRPETPGQSHVQIAYDFDRVLSPAEHQGQPPGPVIARIPLAVVGVSPNRLLRGTARITITVQGKTWPRPDSIVIGSIERIAGVYWQTIYLEPSRLDLLKQHPASLHAPFDLEIVNDEVETRMPLTQGSFFLPHAGVCHTFIQPYQTQFTCRAGLAPMIETDVRSDSAQGPGQIIAGLASPSTPWGLTPTTDSGSANFSPALSNPELAFIPRHKIANLQRTIDARDIQLINYVHPQ